MPIMRNSPWAKLTMSMTPKMIVSPNATIARTMPSNRPATMELSRISITTCLFEVSGVGFQEGVVDALTPQIKLH